MTALRNGVVFKVRDELRTLRLSGPDRVRFLNGMVTNDVSKLTQTQACWAIKTNNRGRIEGLLRLRAMDDSIYLDLDDSVAGRVLSVLDQYIIMDDCAIEDISGSRRVITLIGAESTATLKALGLTELPQAQVDGAVTHHDSEILICDRSYGPWGYELHLPAARAEEIIKSLIDKGVQEASDDALEVLRVESGRVRNSIDLDEDTIPMEARLEYAIDFEKGCYVGQEVIARATNLGQVNYLLVGLRFEQSVEPAQVSDTELFLPDTEKVVGEICSVVYSAELEAWIGLGYVHRKYEAVGTPLTCRGAAESNAAIPVSVSALPFISPEAQS